MEVNDKEHQLTKKVLSLLLCIVGILLEYLQDCMADFAEICNSEVQGKHTSYINLIKRQFKAKRLFRHVILLNIINSAVL